MGLGHSQGGIAPFFRWPKEKGVTTVITAEQGEKSLTHHRLEEYEAERLRLLAYADADRPIVMQIRCSQDTAVIRSSR